MGGFLEGLEVFERKHHDGLLGVARDDQGFVVIATRSIVLAKLARAVVRVMASMIGSEYVRVNVQLFGEPRLHVGGTRAEGV